MVKKLIRNFFFAALLATLVVASLIVFALYSLSTPDSFPERDAPELGETYVLAEDAVLTSAALVLPGPLGFGPERTVRQIMTPEYYAQLKRNIKRFGVSEQFPYPDMGKVGRGTRLTVDQVFLYSDVNATVRYARAQLIDPGRGECTVYINIDEYGDMPSILKAVK